MNLLSIDIETYSSVELKKCGIYKYVESPDFTILLIAYAINDDPVKVLQPHKDDLTGFKAMLDKYTKSAWNATFERLCLNRFFNLQMKAGEFRCTQFQALNHGLHARLDTTAKALQLPEQKIHTSLINWFCVPTKDGMRRLPKEYPEKWAEFIEYCRQDVVTERAVRHALPDRPLEWKLYALDAEINDRGVKIDLDLVKRAIELDEVLKVETMSKLRELMGLKNPNSDSQFKSWLAKQGVETNSINKATVEEILDRQIPNIVRKALELRKLIKNVSVRKYNAMIRSVCKDGRIRGLFQCYGASRTGRFAGRIVQIQNLYRNKAENLAEIREYTKSGKDPRTKYGADMLSQLIRTAFVGSFSILDFSAIEARVLAWLANEEWVMDVFAGDGKIYEAQGAKMFGIDVNLVTKDSEYRAKGKIATLSCGYQGALGALRRMGMDCEGDSELLEIVKAWRKSRPKTVKMWYDIEKIAIQAVKYGKRIKAYHCAFFTEYKGRHGWLYIELPSYRRLAYYKPFIKDGSLCYYGNDLGNFTVVETYGGRLVENIVQAIARDCLVVAMMRLKHLPIVATIHDEIIVDQAGALEEMRQAFEKSIPWAPELILKADGFESKFYKK